MIPCNPDDGLVSVVCTECDPPGVVYVQPGVETPDPYICTACQKRAMRRLENEMSPWAGRMQHGQVDVMTDFRESLSADAGEALTRIITAEFGGGVK